MANVDQRVVQMVFDKGNFESAVQSVIKTLDNLKQNLKFDKASQSFGDLSKASKNVDFSSLSNSVDTIADRFSNLGIIGMSVLNNLTNTAVDAGKRLLSAITSPIIEGGKRRALNIEAAKFQIEGLGYTWEQVSDDIDYAVSGTAYGLDAAAKAAGQLLASSVQIGPEMKSALRGISGVAAMTSSEYDDIANVFTTVAGNGRLMASELNRLSARGINAAATLGKYLGKSEAEVREMTSKGKIDFATFAAAMDSAFGEHAKDANKTFTGALSNMKAALARIGASFATPAYEHMRDILNSLRIVFNNLHTAMAPVIEAAKVGMSTVADYLTGIFDKMAAFSDPAGANGIAKPMQLISDIISGIAQSLWNLFRAAMAVIAPIGQAFLNAFGGTLLDVLARVTKGIAEFTERLIMSERMSDNIRKTFEGIFTVLAVVFDLLATIAGTVAGVLSTAFVTVFGFFADILLRITGFLGEVIVLIKQFVDNILQLDIIKAIMEAISNIFIRFGEIILGAVEALQNFIYTLLDNSFNLAIDIFTNLAGALAKVGEWLTFAWQKLVEFVDYVKQLPIVQGTIQRVREEFEKLKEHVRVIADIVKTYFVSAFNKAKEALRTFIGVVRDLIGETIQLPSVQEMLTGLVQFIKDAFNNSKDIFEFVSKVVKELVERIKELTGTSFEKAIENFNNFKEKVIEFVNASEKLEYIKNALKNVGEFFADFADQTGGFIGQVKDKLMSFVDWVKEKISGITLGEVIATGAATSFIAFFLQLAKLMNTVEKLAFDVGSFTSKFAKIPDNINKVLESVSTKIKGDKLENRMKAFADIVKSIALLAAALALLTTLDQAKLLTSSAILVSVTGIMVLLVGALSYFTKTVDPKALTASIGVIVAIAGSLILLSLALKIISGISTNNLVKSVIAIGVVMALLTGAVIALANFGTVVKGAHGTQIMASAGVIVGMAAAILMIAGALALLAMIPPANLLKAVSVITVLMAVMSVVVMAANKAKAAKGAFGTLMGIAISLNLLVLALKVLGNMNAKELITGLVNLILLMGFVATLMLATRLAGSYAQQAGIAILAISGALILMGAAIKILGNLSNGEIATAIVTLSWITVMFTIFSAITRLAGKNGSSAGQAILMMSGGLILLAAAMAILAQIDPAGLQRATEAVNGLMFMFALVVASTYLVKSAQTVIRNIAIAIAALAAALIVLSLIEPANLAAATLALDSLMVCFAILISIEPMAKQALPVIAVMTLVVAALAGMLLLLATINPDGVLKVAEGLSMFMLSMAAFCAIMAVVGALAEAALAGIIVLGAMFTALIAAVTAIAAFRPQLEAVLDQAIPVLKKIAEGIGEFIGTLIGSVLSSASNALVTVGENLTKFMDSFMPFIDSLKGLDDSATQGIQTLTGMIGTLAAADMANSLNKAFGGSNTSLSQLAEQLPAFGEAMKSFANELNGIDTGSLKNAAEAAKALTEMANNLPRENGWVDTIFGKSVDMSSFGEQLKGFAVALKSVGEEAEGVKFDAINNLIEPTRALIELADAIPEQDGWLQVIVGNKDLGTFGESLAAYARAFKHVSQVVSEGINYQAISDLIGPTRDLIELSKTIEEIGGLGDLFTGADDLGSFGANLAAFGDKMRTFAGYINEIDSSAFEPMEKLIPVLKGFAEVQSALPTSGGLFGTLFGDQNFNNIASGLENLGLGLQKYAAAMEGVKTETIVNSVGAVEAMVKISNLISESQNIFSAIGEAIVSAAFASSLASLGNGMLIYSAYVKGIDFDAIEASVSGVDSFVDVVKKMPNIVEMISAFASSVVGFAMFPVIAKSIAGGLKAFADEVTGIDVSNVGAAADAASALSGAIKNMPNIGDMIAAGLGQLTGNTFADFTGALAKGLTTFSDEASSINVAKINQAITVLKKLMEMSKTSGDFYGLKAIGEGLETFGGKFRTFYSQLTNDISVEKLQDTLNAISDLNEALSGFSETFSESMSEFGNKLTEAGNNIVTTITTIFDTNQQSVHDSAYNLVNQINIAADEALESTTGKFDSIGGDISKKLSDGIRGAGDSVGQAILFIMQWAIDTINGKQGEYNTAGSELMNALSQGINSGTSAVQSAVETVLAAALSRAQNYKSRFQQLGVQLMTAMASGITTSASKIRSAINSAISSASNGVDTSKFRTIGKNCAQGMADGIRDKIGEVRAAAAELGRAAAEATKAATNQNSPSKVFHQIGAYCTLGMANGMRDLAGEVVKAGDLIADEAINTMSGLGSYIQEAITEDMDLNPMITPILDSSQLRNGLGSIFGTSYGANMASRAFGQIGFNYAYERNQNGTSDAIMALGTQFKDVNQTLEDIRNRIDKLELAVNIDGKQFVKATMKPMNKALGAQARREGIG